MKSILVAAMILTIAISNTSASFLFQETDPYCSISGTTHNSFPGEISDTSSWSIPTAYESACDETPELSDSEKERISNVMVTFFHNKDFTGPEYGGGSNLNLEGQKFVKFIFFPAIIKYINNERKKTNPNMTNIAVLNTAVKVIGYDYFIGDR